MASVQAVSPFALDTRRLTRHTGPTFSPSHQQVTASMFSTFSITWLCAPWVMLGAYPLTRRFGLFWNDDGARVQIRALNNGELLWQSGSQQLAAAAKHITLPLNFLFGAPIVVLLLTASIILVYLAVDSAEETVDLLAREILVRDASLINASLRQTRGTVEAGDSASDARLYQIINEGSDSALHAAVLDRRFKPSFGTGSPPGADAFPPDQDRSRTRSSAERPL